MEGMKENSQMSPRNSWGKRPKLGPHVGIDGPIDWGDQHTRQHQRSEKRQDGRRHAPRGPTRTAQQAAPQPRKQEDCAYCYQRPGDTLEHFIPFNSGLDVAHSKVNLIPVCRECNEQKGGAWPSRVTSQLFQGYWKAKIKHARASVAKHAGEAMAAMFQSFMEDQVKQVEDTLRMADALQRSARGTLPAEGYRVRGGKRRRRR